MLAAALLIFSLIDVVPVLAWRFPMLSIAVVLQRVNPIVVPHHARRV